MLKAYSRNGGMDQTRLFKAHIAEVGVNKVSRVVLRSSDGTVLVTGFLGLTIGSMR